VSSIADAAPQGASGAEVSDYAGYQDSVIRFLTIASVFWGVVGFLVGLVIASQLAWPSLNLARQALLGQRLAEECDQFQGFPTVRQWVDFRGYRFKSFFCLFRSK